jgi:hypothetical protein
MPSSFTSVKESELERERLINENLDLKLHIQYLEDLVADNVRESSFLEYLNPPKDKTPSKQSLLEQKLEDARIQLDEARKEADMCRNELEFTKQKLAKFHRENGPSAESMAPVKNYNVKVDAAINTDFDQNSNLLREIEHEKLLRAELEISREFANVEVSSLNGFNFAMEAEIRISELEKSLEETKAASQFHKRRLL